MLHNAPFMAYHSPEMNRHQFLGSGYYFWENNIEMAMVWGRVRYDDIYFILEVQFDVTEENCFDLVGNRNHQLYLVDCLEKLYKNFGINRNNWSISQCVYFLRKFNVFNQFVLPFNFFRVVDLHTHSTSKTQYALQFLAHRGNYTIINPRIIVCAFQKEGINLTNKRIVFSSPIVSL